MKSSKITAIILTKNEERRLPLILENLKDFAEIVVFDGGSTDNTESICVANGVTFISRPLGLRETVNGDIRFALGKVQTPYVLYVNCSHYYPPLLLDEFKQVAKEGRYSAVYHDIVIYTYGQIVHRPFFRRTSSATNFYRVDAVNFANSIVHNEAPVEVAEYLKWKVPAEDNFAIHLFRDYNVKKAETNHSFYGDMDSTLRFESGIRTSPWLIVWHPLRTFLFQYIRCGSIRHATAGFIYALLYAQLELNIQIKIWELQNSMDIHSIIRRNLSMRAKMLYDDFAITSEFIEGSL
jgi:glycosyltransferase involved in cell wall biosynthesis